MLIKIIELIAERMKSKQPYDGVKFAAGCRNADAFNHDGHDIANAILDGDEALAKSLLCSVIDKMADHLNFFIGDGYSSSLKTYVNSVAWAN